MALMNMARFVPDVGREPWGNIIYYTNVVGGSMEGNSKESCCMFPHLIMELAAKLSI